MFSVSVILLQYQRQILSEFQIHISKEIQVMDVLRRNGILYSDNAKIIKTND